MGAFPSHDAPELIYSMLVLRPSTNSQVEVCLVPLLPRFFNDGHKKAKKKLNELLASKGAHQSSLAASLAPRAPATIAPGKVPDQGIGHALVDYFISSTEGSFFVTTKDAVVSKVAMQAEQGQRERSDISTTGGRSAPGTASTGETQPSNAPSHTAHHSSSHQAMSNSVRPVPFAVCIVDSDVSTGTPGTTGGSAQATAAKHHHVHANNVVLIKGRRLQLVGFIACCMDRPVRHMTTANPVKPHGASGGAGATSGEGKKQGIPVCLDVIFDDTEAHGFLTESVVLLASFAFRKQFLNCCALHFRAGDPDVESSFGRHMDPLQLRLVMRHDNYRILRLFHSRYPLLDMVKELRVSGGSSAPQFSLYENDGNEVGLEVTFGMNFLTRWMRFVEKMMHVETVVGNHIRCGTTAIMSERDKLIQERRDSGAFLEEEEDDERIFGGAVYAVSLRRWAAAEKQAVQQQQQVPLSGASPMYVYPTTAAPGQYWPQMSVMMGQPPGWPTSVVPLSAAAAAPTAVAPVIGQQQPFVIQASGTRPQLYYASPQPTVSGNATFVTQSGIPIVQQAATASPFGVAATQPASGQQIVYVMQGAQSTSASVAAPTVSAMAPGMTPQAFYYPQTTAYAVPYSPYGFQQQPQQQLVTQATHIGTQQQQQQQQQVTSAGQVVQQ